MTDPLGDQETSPYFIRPAVARVWWADCSLETRSLAEQVAMDEHPEDPTVELHWDEKECRWVA